MTTVFVDRRRRISPGPAGISVLDFGARGDGVTNDAAALQSALAAAVAQQCDLHIPARAYLCTGVAGWLFNRAGVQRLSIVADEGAEIVVSDQGIRAIAAAGGSLSCEGLALRRTTQAPWGAARTGLHFEGGHQRVETCRISRFTDAISSTLAESAVIEGNRLQELGEEPIVVRRSAGPIRIRDNRATRYLGDGILLKSCADVVVEDNRLVAPAQIGDADYAALSAGQTDNPLLPRAGGGITSNDEDNTGGSEDIRVGGNLLRGTVYGIALEAARHYSITENIIEGVLDRGGIEVIGGAQWNPAGVDQEDCLVAGNRVSGVGVKVGVAGWSSSRRHGIRVEPNAAAGVEVRRVLVQGNIVVPGTSEGGTKHDALWLDGDVFSSGNIVADYWRGVRLGGGAQSVGDTFMDGGTGANAAADLPAGTSGCVLDAILDGPHHVSVSGSQSSVQVRGRYTGTGAAVVLNGGAAGNVVLSDALQPNSTTHVSYATETERQANTVRVIRNPGAGGYQEWSKALRLRGSDPRLSLLRHDIAGASDFDLLAEADGAAPGMMATMRRGGTTFQRWRHRGSVDFGVPVLLGSYTMATLPSAATFANCLIAVSDAPGGACLAFARGGSWLPITMGAAL